MAKKKRTSRGRSSNKRKVNTSFVSFIEEPHIAAALLVFALIALVLSIMEFADSLK